MGDLRQTLLGGGQYHVWRPAAGLGGADVRRPAAGFVGADVRRPASAAGGGKDGEVASVTTTQEA